MLTIEFRFPGGRYHATPWNHHVNEGVIEWPPSPFRILRALISTWYLKAQEEITEAQLRSLCESLGSELPIYRVPPVLAMSHTRHYMPVRTGNTTKVFDAFLRLDPDDALAISWPEVTLESEEQRALGLLLERLSYLGRAESWVEARLTDQPLADTNVLPADPADRGESSTSYPTLDPNSTSEEVSILCPLPPSHYRYWRQAEIDRQLTHRLQELRQKAADKGKSVDKVKLSKKDNERIEQGLPADLFAALQADTNVLRKQGWSAAPGTRTIRYLRPALRPATPQITLVERTPPTVVRFAISGNVLPVYTDAIRLAEAVRGILVASRLSVFHGKDHSGARLQGHRHAMYLPESSDGRGHLTHLTLVAKMGLDEDAREAIDRLCSAEVRLKEGATHPLKLTLMGMGQPTDLGDTGAPLLRQARRWVSITPFISTRHEKRRRDGSSKLDAHGRAIGSPEHDLLRLLKSSGFPEPKQVESVDYAKLGDRKQRWISYRRWRDHGGGARVSGSGRGFRLEFEKPVRGPIALGYGAHFGLGLFAPDDG